MKQFKVTASITKRENKSFKQYLKDVSMISMITPEEEILLTAKTSKGDKQAIDRLVKANLRFVISVAKKYATEQIPLEDLVNEGNIGLMKAAEKYSPDSGVRFISYAIWWIRKTIMEHITKYGKMVRIPANKVNSLSKLNQMVSDLEQKNGRQVDIREVASVYSNEISSDDFMFLDVLTTYHMDSLDRSISYDDGGGTCLGDFLSDDNTKSTDHLLNDSDLRQEISKILDVIKPRDKRIMEALFGLDGKIPMGLKEVGEEVGISREMVRQIKEKSLRMLRNNSRIRVAYDNLD
jgi:RNA polymerase primary sigma factor